MPREQFADTTTDLPESDLKEYHQFALQIADASKELILELWKGGSFGETLKEDKTPVSEVDLQAEALARKMISERFPKHGIIGEEYDSINPESDFQWTLDPIDGTQNLINHIPTFGTLIGLRYCGKAIIGIIDHPVLNMRTHGGLHLGVSYNGSDVVLADLPENSLSSNDIIATNSLAVFGEDPKEQKLFSDIMAFHENARIYYDCYDQTLAVLGSLAVAMEPNLKIWDITPLEALLSELGGGCMRFNERGVSSDMLTHAVFGKKRAVELLCNHLGV